MKYSDNFYKLIIFTIELIATALLLFGGYVIFKTYDKFNTLGIASFYFGSLIIISFVLDDYYKEFLCLKTIKTVLVVDIVIVLSLSFSLLTTFGYTIKISEILIDDLRNIRTITGKTRLLYWITTRIEGLFGCCRTFDMVSFVICLKATV